MDNNLLHQHGYCIYERGYSGAFFVPMDLRKCLKKVRRQVPEQRQ